MKKENIRELFVEHFAEVGKMVENKMTITSSLIANNQNSNALRRELNWMHYDSKAAICYTLCSKFSRLHS